MSIKHCKPSVSSIANKVAEDVKANGYSVLRECFSLNELQEVRTEIFKEYLLAPWVKGKLLGPSYSNNCVPWAYTSPLSYGTSRLYIQENSRPQLISEKTQELKEIMLKVESLLNPSSYINRKRTFFDIISIYGSTDGYSKHVDAKGDYYELQAQHTITEKGCDFEGGDLILYLKNGKKINIWDDLNVTSKDIVIFDKRLVHEVTSVKKMPNGLGRWMALYNASVNEVNHASKIKSSLKSRISYALKVYRCKKHLINLKHLI